MAISRGLVRVGRSLSEEIEASAHSKAHPLLTARAFAQGSPLDFGEAVPPLPCLAEGLQPDQLEHLSVLYKTVLEEIGYERSDLALHWFRSDLIGEFLPTVDELLCFEHELLEHAGTEVVNGTRFEAYKKVCEVLGAPSRHERRDWTALPVAFVRDFEALSMDDDRALMVSRLERIAREAADALDIGKALQAQNALARVQSLTFQDDTRGQKMLAQIFGSQAERSSDAAVQRDTPLTRKLSRVE